uniref:hypothetical protein n=1 Tax=uncultured Tateyamaria sp. TaxID=455651 RepID=UPI00260F74FC
WINWRSDQGFRIGWLYAVVLGRRDGGYRCEISRNALTPFIPISTDGAKATRPAANCGSLLLEAQTTPLADPHTYARIYANPLTA